MIIYYETLKSKTTHFIRLFKKNKCKLRGQLKKMRRKAKERNERENKEVSCKGKYEKWKERKELNGRRLSMLNINTSNL